MKSSSLWSSLSGPSPTARSGGRHRALLGLALATSVGLAACSHELSGPQPELATPSPELDPLPVDPPIVCRDQLETEVRLHGSGFSPLPIGLPDSLELLLPSLRLEQARTLVGEPLPQDLVPQRVLFSGRAGEDNAERLGWLSQEELALFLSPTLRLPGQAEPGPLAPGLFDVVVENANGNAVTSATGIAAVERPFLEGVSPGIVCLSQGPAVIELTGRGFLAMEDRSPTLQAGEDQRFALDTRTDCEAIAHPGVTAELCQRSERELPQDSLPPGFHALRLDNPATAPCVSEETLSLRVVPPPAIERVDPPLICTSEEARDVTIYGSWFLRIDGRVPSVLRTDASGQAGELEVLSLGGDCQPLEAFGHEVEVCTELAVRIPREEVAAPYWPELVLRNPSPAGCSAATSTGLTVVPAPLVAQVEPAAACGEQEARRFVLSGSTFLEIAGEPPSVQVAGSPTTPQGLSGCEDLAVEGLAVRICTTAEVELAAAAVDLAGADWLVAPVTLANPAPAGCGVEASDLLTLLPPPQLDAAEPELLCAANGERSFLLHGRGFVAVDESLPQVLLDGQALPVDELRDCEAVPANGLALQTCRTAALRLPPELAQVAAGSPFARPTLALENPAPVGCAKSEPELLTLVPPPVIEALEPPALCGAQEDRELTLQGAGFLRVGGAGGALPTVEIDGAALEVLGLEGCAAIPSVALAVEGCTSIRVRLPAGSLDPGTYAVLLTNPAPAGCQAQAQQDLLVVAPPAPGLLAPPTVCGGGEVPVTLQGQEFWTVNGEAPTVRIGDQVLAAAAVTPQDCEDVPLVGLTLQRCAALALVFDFSALPLGGATVEVANPAPLGCAGALGQPIAVLAPPTVESAEPALVCGGDEAREVVLRGSGFRRVGEQQPWVQIAGEVAEVLSLGGCSAESLDALSWEDCSEMTLRLPQGDLGTGALELVIVPPASAGCTLRDSETLVGLPSPQLQAALPSSVCNVAGDREVLLQGSGFVEIDGQGPTVLLNETELAAGTLGACEDLEIGGFALRSCGEIGVVVPADTFPDGELRVTVRNPAPADCVATAQDLLAVVPPPEVESLDPVDLCAVDGETLRLRGSSFLPRTTVTLGEGLEGSVQYIDDTTLDVTFFGLEEMEPGVYDLRVSNGDGCEDVVVGGIRLHPNPLVFFVDPPVAYNGIRLQVTIYTAGLDAPPAQVTLLGPSGQQEALDATVREGRNNRLLATLPLGLEPGGWGVEVRSRVGCVGYLDEGLRVTDDRVLALSAVEPRYVSPNRATAVTLRANPEPPAGEVGFVATPRGYLNPSGGAEDSLATGLRALLFVDPATLTAVVPAGLVPGDYDLVVVNPSGEVGLLEAALTVTDGEPPLITAVEPASLDVNSPQVARVVGQDFDVAGGVTLAMTCRDAASGEVRTEPVQVVDGSLTAGSVQGVFPSDRFAAGTVCLVRITNSDGAFFEYSAISLKNPAQNLNPWAPASPMVEARRGLSLVAGRPTYTSRYVYAIGGDEGGFASAKQSVEAAAVDVFGDLRAWSLQRHSLPAARSFAGQARAERFVYLAGGHDGQTAQSTVLRAEILDPLDTPEVSDLFLALEGKQPRLAGGTWIYRIAAVYPDDDPNNPGGESLPGEPLVVQLPDRTGLVLTLIWDPMPGASGYRIYRTAEPGQGLEHLELLAEVDGNLETRYADGGGATDPTQVPLPPGSLGVWHELVATPLQQAREGLALLAAPVPGSPSSWYLYAFGGRSAGGGYLDTYEFARVDQVEREGRIYQDVSPWLLGSGRLSQGRAELGAYLVSNIDNPAVSPGRTWVFVGAGRSQGGFSRAVEAQEVPANGDLGAFILTDSVNNDRAGYGYGAANGFLFVFGGQGGGPSDGGISGELCRSEDDPSCGQAPGEPPDIRNWNNLGVRLSQSRVYMGSAQESAFFFVAGGFDGVAATRSVDQTVQ